MFQQLITLPPLPRGLHLITARIRAVVAASGVQQGLANIFVHHTSASLLIQECADPTVLEDLEAFFARLIPDGDPRYRHSAEGPDDMPAHIRAAITSTSLLIPVRNAQLDLGTWQGVFLWEHRLSPRARRLTVSVL